MTKTIIIIIIAVIAFGIVIYLYKKGDEETGQTTEKYYQTQKKQSILKKGLSSNFYVKKRAKFENLIEADLGQPQVAAPAEGSIISVKNIQVNEEFQGRQYDLFGDKELKKLKDCIDTYNAIVNIEMGMVTNNYKLIYEISGDGSNFLTNEEILFSKDGRTCLYFYKEQKLTKSTNKNYFGGKTFLILRTRLKAPFQPGSLDSCYVLNEDYSQSYENNDNGIFISPILIAKKAINLTEPFVQTLGKFYIFKHKQRDINQDVYNDNLESQISVYDSGNLTFSVDYQAYVNLMKNEYRLDKKNDALQIEGVDVQVFRYLPYETSAYSYDSLDFFEFINFPNLDLKLGDPISWENYGTKIPVEKLTLTSFGSFQISYGDFITAQFGFRNDPFLDTESNFVLLVLQTLSRQDYFENRNNLKKYSQYDYLLQLTQLRTRYFPGQELSKLKSNAYFERQTPQHQVFQTIMTSKDQKYGFKCDFVFDLLDLTKSKNKQIPKNVKYIHYEVKDKNLDFLCEEKSYINNLQLMNDFRVRDIEKKDYLLKFIKMFNMTSQSINLIWHYQQQFMEDGTKTNLFQGNYFKKAVNPLGKNYINCELFIIKYAIPQGQLLTHLIIDEKGVSAVDKVYQEHEPDTSIAKYRVTFERTDKVTFDTENFKKPILKQSKIF